jgi:hypothetical protein
MYLRLYVSHGSVQFYNYIILVSCLYILIVRCVVFCVFCIIVFFCILSLCKLEMYYCHRVSKQLQLTNTYIISCHIKPRYNATLIIAHPITWTAIQPSILFLFITLKLQWTNSGYFELVWWNIRRRWTGYYFSQVVYMRL